MTVDELNIIVTADSRRFDTAIQDIRNRLNNLGSSATSTSNTVASAFKAMAKPLLAIFSVTKAFGFVKDSIIAGMDAIESDSLFLVSLGERADEARKWTDELSAAVGLNAVELRKNVGVLYNMITAMGLSKDTAYSMATGMTELANDMASFYNISTEEAFVKIRAGLTGEIVPLKHIGILVDDNTIKQVAYKKGIAETGKELTQQQKVLARYEAILMQTGNAQGDLARTLQSPANQLRVLKAKFDALKIAVGKAFQPMISVILPAITEAIINITPGFVSLVKSLSKLFFWFANLSDTSIAFLKVTVLLAAALKGMSIASALLLAVKKRLIVAAYGEATAQGMDAQATTWNTIAHGLLSKATTVLTAKVTTLRVALMASIKTLLAVAAVATILYAVFGRSTDEFSDTEYAFDMTSDGADKMANSLGNAADSVNGLKEATKALAGFDEINVLGSSDSLVGNMIDQADINAAFDYTDAMEKLQKELNELNNKNVSIDVSFETHLNWAWSQLWHDLFNDFDEFLAHWKMGWEDIKLWAKGKLMDVWIGIAQFINKVKLWIGIVWNFFKDSWVEFWGNWKSGIDDIKEWFSDTWNKFKAWIGIVWNFFKDDWNEFWGNFAYGWGEIAKWFGNTWETFKSWAGIVWNFFKDDWNTFWDNWDTGWSDIKDWFDSITKNIKAWAETLFKPITDAWDKAWAGIKAGFSTEEGGFSIAAALGGALGAGNSVKQYATGGFPDYGQIFIANERGPELVGNIGGRTAVANNDMIVQAIESAVYRAMSSAQTGGNSSGDIHLTTYLYPNSAAFSRDIIKAQNLENTRNGGRR